MESTESKNRTVLDLERRRRQLLTKFKEDYDRKVHDLKERHQKLVKLGNATHDTETEEEWNLAMIDYFQELLSYAHSDHAEAVTCEREAADRVRSAQSYVESCEGFELARQAMEGVKGASFRYWLKGPYGFKSDGFQTFLGFVGFFALLAILALVLDFLEWVLV